MLRGRQAWQLPSRWRLHSHWRTHVSADLLKAFDNTCPERHRLIRWRWVSSARAGLIRTMVTCTAHQPVARWRVRIEVFAVMIWSRTVCDLQAFLKLTAGVVVFSVGVNEGSPQASRPTGPAEHACIVFHIHIVSICGRGEHRYVAPCPLRKSDESPRSPSRVVVVVSNRWTSSPFRLGQRLWPLWPSAALIPH
jgi:hypothetical protein